MEIGDNLTAIIIVVVVILGPVWLTMHYRAKNRTSNRLSDEDSQALAQMAQAALTLENRVATLERILDTEVPSWRAKQ